MCSLWKDIFNVVLHAQFQSHLTFVSWVLMDRIKLLIWPLALLLTITLSLGFQIKMQTHFWHVCFKTFLTIYWTRFTTYIFVPKVWNSHKIIISKCFSPRIVLDFLPSTLSQVHACESQNIFLVHSYFHALTLVTTPKLGSWQCTWHNM
jgi:hypothetical protein